MREWEEVLTGLDSDRRFALLGYYEHARVLSWTDESIEVGFSADVASVCEMASQRDHIEQMLQFLSRRYGKTYRLSLRVMNDADEARVSEARSILEVDRDRREADKQNRELEAREHPITKMVMQTFGADIQEIKTDVQ